MTNIMPSVKDIKEEEIKIESYKLYEDEGISGWWCEGWKSEYITIWEEKEEDGIRYYKTLDASDWVEMEMPDGFIIPSCWIA